MLSTAVLGSLVVYLNATKNAVILGRLIAAVASVGYIGAITCYWKAGKDFIKMKQSKSRLAVA